MIDRDLAALLEECLQRLDRGEDLPALLADYPRINVELKSVLLVAMASRAFPVPVPRQTARRLGRNQLLAEMNRLEIKKAFRKRSTVPFISQAAGFLAGLLRQGGYNKLAYSYRLAMVTLVLIFSGSFLTLNASASSQPGDFLYTLKVSLERSGLVWLVDAEESPQITSSPEGNPDFQVPVGSKRSAWNIEGSNYLLDRLERQDAPQGQPFLIDSSTAEDGDDLKDEAKDLAEAEREEEKDLAEAEREAEKDLKEDEKAADKEADKQEKEAAKEADKEEKEAEKEEKEAEKEEKEADKEEKEADKEEKEADKEAEKEDKDADKAEKEAEKEDKDADKAEKEKTTKDKKIEKPAKENKDKDKEKEKEKEK